MTWLAGATPFETSKDGETVTINLTGDKNVKTFTDFWQKMIDEDLIDTKTSAGPTIGTRVWMTAPSHPC